MVRVARMERTGARGRNACVAASSSRSSLTPRSLADVSTLQASNKTATLAPSFASLATKKLDLEATVDPLFKKTCADFDEGGATGLLMNGLGVDRDGKLVFDASGSSLGDGEDDDEDEYEYGEGEDEDMDEATKKKKRSRTVDVSALKGTSSPSARLSALSCALTAHPLPLLSQVPPWRPPGPALASYLQLPLDLRLLLGPCDRP